ncbi:MAG TPA: hypothetical protein VGI06_04525, partial [Acidimicrobiales bacterium]
MEERLRFVRQLADPLRVSPGKRVTLADFDPGDTGGLPDEAAAAPRLEEGLRLLVDYQDRLSAQHTFGVLVVLQGLDGAGKD